MSGITFDEWLAEFEKVDETAKDELYRRAVCVVVDCQRASRTLLQQRLDISCMKAGILMERMIEDGILDEYTGSSRPRKVFMKRK